MLNQVSGNGIPVSVIPPEMRVSIEEWILGHTTILKSTTWMPAVNTLRPGWLYHAINIMEEDPDPYQRFPHEGIIICDISPDPAHPERVLAYNKREHEARSRGFECLPVLYTGPLGALQSPRSLLEGVSLLGGYRQALRLTAEDRRYAPEIIYRG